MALGKELRDRASALGRWIFQSSGRPAFWAATVAILLAVPLALALRRPFPTRPPVLGALPAFELVDQEGAPFTAARMRGRVWIANFIFTRCPGPCANLTDKMFRVQHRLRNMNGAVQLVSFTVDPEHDTPERLAAYAERFRANPRVWTFVTGPAERMKYAVVSGFKIAMGKGSETPSEDDFLTIFHGEHFVLVDRVGRIRGYYDGSEEAQDRLLRDAGLLTNMRDDF